MTPRQQVADRQRRLREYAQRKAGVLTLEEAREMAADADLQHTNLLVRFEQGALLPWANEVESTIQQKEAEGWTLVHVAFTKETFRWATCGTQENPHQNHPHAIGVGLLEGPCVKCGVWVDWTIGRKVQA